MCGICGIYNSNPEQVDQNILKEMCNSLAHRGPDDEGIFIDTNLGIGHRRLSIIDLKLGHQPMHNEDKSVWLVSNNEIYNYKQLRQELELKGHRFYTHSDTEVILHAYEQFGRDCVQHFNGMFAFCIWDKKKRLLFLARDRLGIKPLYYAQTDNKFIFASELKAILKSQAVQREIDIFSLSKYLFFEYVPDPDSIFAGIKKLPPAHILVFQNGKTIIERYWNIDFGRKKLEPINEDECIEEFRGLLKESVAKRLMSEVPLGVLLSGGMDSSSILALMSQMIPGDEIKTFSIGFEESSFDESSYARSIAKHFNTQHHEFRSRPQHLMKLIPNLSKILDEPMGDAAIVIYYFFVELVRKHVKVALGGDGGDELLAGYPTYPAHLLASYYEKVPFFLRSSILEKVIKRLPVSMRYFSFDFKAKRFIAGMPFPSTIRNQVWMSSFPYQEQMNLLLPDISKTISEDNLFSPIIQAQQICNARDLIDRISFQDIKLYLANNMLPLVDRTSMAFSLEVRVPFLDHTLIEYVMQLPYRLRLRGPHLTDTKYVLRRSMEKLLPKEIYKRKKIGLNIPVAQWIRKELKDYVLSYLCEERIKRENLFNYKYIDKLLRQHFEGKKDNRKQIWTLLMFELWYEQWQR